MYKYVNDLISVIPVDKHDGVRMTFITYDAHIQFCLETESNNLIPFFDILVVGTLTHSITVDCHQKVTNFDRFMHYNCQFITPYL